MSRSGITVAICTYNGAIRLPLVLEALAGQTLERSQWDVLVVDNASSDNTAQVATTCWRRTDVDLRVIKEPARGQSRAREAARRAADREFLCFCDDDNLLDPDYLKIGFEFMQSAVDVGIGGGCGRPESESELPGWFDSVAEAYAVGPQGDAPGEVSAERGFVWGAGMILRRRAWDAISHAGFRPRFPGRQGSELASGDDNELCCALALAGWKIHYSPQLGFRHRIPAGRLSSDYCRRLYYSFGEAAVVLNVYRDFLLRRATPHRWRMWAMLRWLQGLQLALVRNKSTATGWEHPTLPMFLREYQVGMAKGYQRLRAAGGLFAVYRELGAWILKLPHPLG